MKKKIASEVSHIFFNLKLERYALKVYFPSSANWGFADGFCYYIAFFFYKSGPSWSKNFMTSEPHLSCYKSRKWLSRPVRRGCGRSSEEE